MTQDELQERIESLKKSSQAEYDKDPVMAVIQYLRDTESDLEDAEDVKPFVDGFGYALHQVEEMYLRYDAGYTCGCPNPNQPFIEKLSSGNWVCADCGEVVAGKGEFERSSSPKWCGRAKCPNCQGYSEAPPEATGDCPYYGEELPEEYQ